MSIVVKSGIEGNEVFALLLIELSQFFLGLFEENSSKQGIEAFGLLTKKIVTRTKFVVIECPQRLFFSFDQIRLIGDVSRSLNFPIESSNEFVAFPTKVFSMFVELHFVIVEHLLTMFLFEMKQSTKVSFGFFSRIEGEGEGGREHSMFTGQSIEKNIQQRVRLFSSWRSLRVDHRVRRIVEWCESFDDGRNDRPRRRAQVGGWNYFHWSPIDGLESNKDWSLSMVDEQIDPASFQWSQRESLRVSTVVRNQIEALRSKDLHKWVRKLCSPLFDSSNLPVEDDWL